MSQDGRETMWGVFGRTQSDRQVLLKEHPSREAAEAHLAGLRLGDAGVPWEGSEPYFTGYDLRETRP